MGVTSGAVRDVTELKDAGFTAAELKDAEFKGAASDPRSGFPGIETSILLPSSSSSSSCNVPPNECRCSAIHISIAENADFFESLSPRSKSFLQVGLQIAPGNPCEALFIGKSMD